MEYSGRAVQGVDLRKPYDRINKDIPQYFLPKYF